MISDCKFSLSPIFQYSIKDLEMWQKHNVEFTKAHYVERYHVFRSLLLDIQPDMSVEIPLTYLFIKTRTRTVGKLLLFWFEFL